MPLVAASRLMPRGAKPRADRRIVGVAGHDELVYSGSGNRAAPFPLGGQSGRAILSLMKLGSWVKRFRNDCVAGRRCVAIRPGPDQMAGRTNAGTHISALRGSKTVTAAPRADRPPTPVARRFVSERRPP